MNQKFHSLITEASKIVLDKQAEIRSAIICLLAGGHLLIEDLPGVGKTTLVQVLGRLTGLKTRRIQFTVDLLPADVLGGQVFHPQDSQFIFHPGPIFSQIVMADELNRASPRTQGALLQAMEEGEVSIDGVNHSLPRPFYVIATQNPYHEAGTFSLPESQLDRFLMSLELHYASKATEIRILQGIDPRRAMQSIEPLLSEAEISEALLSVEKIQVSTTVATYIANLLEQSRLPNFEGTPLSTRAGLALVRSSKACAFLDGRNYVRVEDVQDILVQVLGHRVGGSHGIKRGRAWAVTLQKNTPIPI